MQIRLEPQEWLAMVKEQVQVKWKDSVGCFEPKEVRAENYTDLPTLILEF